MASPFALFPPFPLRRAATVAAAAMLCCGPPPVLAQTSGQTVVVTAGRDDTAPGVTGFADAPLALSPFQAAVFGSERLGDVGARRIGDLVKLDASVGASYNAEGYWSSIAVRGYTLDNRLNYRRDGLPINAETAIALDNKDSIDLLKGTSGIQAGSSAPGGLVDLVVKRPQPRQRTVRLGVSDRSSVLGAIDVGDRAGPDGAFGWRINAAAERLDPATRDSRGHRTLLALAADWQAGPDTLIEAEIESSQQRQFSVAGFSMLGNTVPDADSVDPRVNLNRQPWNLPVVLGGNTASVRWQQRLNATWRTRVHAMTQRLKSDDRTAFPYGVYDPAAYLCAEWCDRFAPDGSFSYWQYVSNNERRNSHALEAAVSGAVVTGRIAHTLEAGILQTRFSGRFEDQIFDIAGTGRANGSADTPPAPGFRDANTNRSDSSTELYLRDAMRLGGSTSLWIGLRHTRAQRASVRTSPDTNGSLRPTDQSTSATIPWVAFAQQLTPQTLVYASWGQGLETEVAPNRPVFVNAGQTLPALKSRQTEVGVKHAAGNVDWSVAAFDISRPQAADLGVCDTDDSCLRAIDGSSLHRGLDGQIQWRAGAWNWRFSGMLLHAERRDTATPGANGNRPVNVPGATLRIGGTYSVAAVPGLDLQAALAGERDRVVLPNDSGARIPGWARMDAAARWTQRAGDATVVWRAAVDNLTNRRAWQEAPYQFGHVYLYPLTPRTWRLSVQAAF